MRMASGAPALLRLALRRDRVRIPVWAAAIGGLTAYTVVALDQLYPGTAERQARAELMRQPAAVLLSGPGFGLGDYSLGAMLANELLLTLVVAVAIMSVLSVMRHTRAEEESGRAELSRAGVVAREAPLVAALLAVAVADLAVGVATFVGLAVAGLGGANAIAVSAALAMTGLVFAAVAAVTAQVSERARTASGLALGILALAFVLRAVGDVSASSLSWLSPLAWAQQTRAYVDLRWWPLLLSAAVVAGLLVVAHVLLARRDLLAGMLPARRGPVEAGSSLSSPLALAWRLQRGGILGWALSLLVAALTVGTLTGAADDLLAGNSAAQELLLADGVDLVDGFLSAFVQFLALAAGAFGVLSVLRWRNEESADRAAVVLAAAVPRARWLGSGVLVALAGSALLLVASGVGLGTTAAVTTGRPGLVWSVLLSSLAYLPAVAVLVGLATALYGVRAGLATVAWVPVAHAVLVGWFGVLLGIPDWAAGLSPFDRTPTLPGRSFELLPLVVLAAIGLVLTGAGGVAYRRRDIG